MADNSTPSVGTGVPAGLTIAAGLVTMLAAICIWIAGLYTWLRYGTWLDYTSPELFKDFGLAYPRVSWVGAQKAIDFVMSLSAAWFLFVLGGLVVWIGGGMLDAHEKRVSNARNVEFARQRDEREAAREEWEAARNAEDSMGN